MSDHRNRTPDPSPAEDPEVVVAVIDPHHVRWSPAVEDWDAATLLTCISEDPADWSEIAAVWPRYRAGPSAEFADALPLVPADVEAVSSGLAANRPWLVLDLQEQRVFSNAAYGEVPRNGCFGWGPDDGFGPAVRMPIHLPPWWLIHSDAEPQDVTSQRASAAGRPVPRRDVLWGPPLSEALAEAMLAVYGSRQWNSSGASRDSRARYRFTVRVHRDWLMTPREELGARIPRQLLHGGIDWIDAVVEGQQWNVTSERGAIPIPRDLSSYAQAPMGRAEVCLYFDLCREMIEEGWQWLVERHGEVASENVQQAATRLAAALRRIQHGWMHAPYQGGSSPATIIQNERDRIPEVAGGGEDDHEADCDCPICQMMHDGLFGPGFVIFDGHHLELDGEFAFSLCETRQEWELEQQEYRGISASIDAEIPQTAGEASGPVDELDSAWCTSFVADEGLPGDPSGRLAIGFLLAEIIGELQRHGGTQHEIDSLNHAFRQYRHTDPADRGGQRVATERFQDVLEQTGRRHEYLISRAADLQSRLDELSRRPDPTRPGDDIRS